MTKRKYPKSFLERLTDEMRSLKQPKPTLTPEEQTAYDKQQQELLKLSMEQGLIDPKAIGAQPPTTPGNAQST